MPAPTPSSSVRARPDIAGSFMEYDVEANMNRAIATRVLSKLETDTQSGTFGKVTLESLLRSADTKRQSGGGYNRGSFEFTDDSYATKENGFEVPVDKRNAKIYGDYFPAEMEAAKLARQTVLVNQEVRAAGLIFDSGTYNTTAVSTEWDTVATAKPITDVESAVQRLYAKGIIANALVMSWSVFRNLRHVDQIIDRITANGAGQSAKPDEITTAQLSTVFTLDHIIVGGMQKNTADEGQDAVLAPVWDDEYVAVTRIAEPDAPVSELCVGRTFHWSEDGSQIGGTFESYEDVTIRGDVVRNRMDTHEKILYTDALELLSNITT